MTHRAAPIPIATPPRSDRVPRLKETQGAQVTHLGASASTWAASLHPAALYCPPVNTNIPNRPFGIYTLDVAEHLCYTRSADGSVFTRGACSLTTYLVSDDHLAAPLSQLRPHATTLAVQTFWPAYPGSVSRSNAKPPKRPHKPLHHGLLPPASSACSAPLRRKKSQAVGSEKQVEGRSRGDGVGLHPTEVDKSSVTSVPSAVSVIPVSGETPSRHLCLYGEKRWCILPSRW